MTFFKNHLTVIFVIVLNIFYAGKSFGAQIKTISPLEEWTGKIFDDRSENFVRVISDQEWKQLSPRAAFSQQDFYHDWRLPITNKHREI